MNIGCIKGTRLMVALAIVAVVGGCDPGEAAAASART